MIYAPNHIKEYVKPILGNNKFFKDDIYGKFTLAYEVNCNCGNNEFVIYKNSEPKVMAFCASCGKAITLYDLIEYPCAVTYRDNEEILRKVINKDNDKFNIAIIPDNTVLLSFKLTIGRVVITDGEMTTNEAIAHFKTDNPFLVEYTYLALKNYKYSNLGSTSSIATAINSKIIKTMPWIMPNEDTINKFHYTTAPIFETIKNN